MEFKDKIKSRRVELGLTLEEIAKMIGVSTPTIQRYESGEIQNMRRDKVKKLADALQLSPAYLMGWETDIKKIYNNKPIQQTKLVPIVGTVACGNPIYAEENIQEYVNVSISDNVDFALYARGNSMNAAKICDGDTVFIRKQSMVNNGEIALVLVNNEATIKKFYNYGDKVVLRPDSTDPQYEEQIYTAKDDIIIQGKVIFIKTYIGR